jgi:hypothetical protein
MAKEKLSITLDPRVLDHVNARKRSDAEADQRGERSGIISRDLDRYYESLKHGRQQLRDKLSKNEIAALLDNLNGVWMGDNPSVSVRMIWANVEDGIGLEGLDKKWKVDGKALVEKLRGMSMIELCALADAAERFWNQVAAGKNPGYLEAIAD